ncbi:MAG: hypothetical protein RIQ99_392, partial [Pseudomonadota bacterium]
MSDEPVNRISTLRSESLAKRPALGRGLGALLGETRREEPLANPAANAGNSGASAAAGNPATGLAVLPVAAIIP